MFYFRYSIPPKHGKRFERIATEYFSEEAKKCPAFIRHKTVFMSPQLLSKYCIPVNKVRI